MIPAICGLVACHSKAVSVLERTSWRETASFEGVVNAVTCPMVRAHQVVRANLVASMAVIQPLALIHAASLVRASALPWRERRCCDHHGASSDL